MNVPVLRRTKADWLAVGAITAIAAVALGFSVATSDISHASLQRENTPGAEHQASYLEAAPEALTEAFRLPNESVAGQFRPIASRGLVMSNDDHTVTATNPDGSTAWTYTRDNVEICSMGTAWDRVVVTYRNGRGCGDVVSIDAATGMYADTRSANNSDTVHAIYSNDRIGTVSSDRVDLWRSDLVRTVEYGDVEAKQEPDLQPNESCTINSALTRTELLVVSETCPSAQGTNFLRFQNTTPEDSREPEISQDVSVTGDGIRLVAVGQSAAAVYVPGETPAVISYDDNGNETSRTDVAPSQAINDSASPFAPATADLPHHMTWFDGERLYLFTPTALRVDHVLEQAIGTGVSAGDRALIPTRAGIDVVNWTTGETERTIPVDRGGYNGQVYLGVADGNIVESRDGELVALTSS